MQLILLWSVPPCRQNRLRYVDEGLAGADSVDEAITLHNQLQNLFDKGGFYFESGTRVNQGYSRAYDMSSEILIWFILYQTPKNTPKPWAFSEMLVLTIFASLLAALPSLDCVTRLNGLLFRTLQRFTTSWDGSAQQLSRPRSFYSCSGKKKRLIGMNVYLIKCTSLVSVANWAWSTLKVPYSQVLPPQRCQDRVSAAWWI